MITLITLALLSTIVCFATWHIGNKPANSILSEIICFGVFNTSMAIVIMSAIAFVVKTW